MWISCILCSLCKKKKKKNVFFSSSFRYML
jgi:hypothetical protein